MRDPVLASKFVYDKDYARPDCKMINLVVKGGLHFIRGNKAPYFSLTCVIYQGKRDIGGGANHELILKHFPQFKPLADLHLSDIDGVPSHSAANAWYWAAGADVELGAHEQYTGANGSSPKTPEECLQIFADYVRVSLNEARGILVALVMKYREVPQYSRVYEGKGAAVAKQALAQWCEAQKPRWKREADECIAKLGLVVYGDQWINREAA